MDAFFVCVDNFYPDNIFAQNNVTNVELMSYMNKDGAFGRRLASVGCENNDDNYDPVGWWSIYGCATPNLQKMAKKILSLTTSSSGCERNWSTFEGIHTKKRNRLDATRLNDLVCVQFNAKIIKKTKRVKEKKIDILSANEASMAQAWIVEGGDEEVEGASGLTWELVDEALGTNDVLNPRRSNRVRELNDEEFISDNETEEEDDDEGYEFMSDGENA